MRESKAAEILQKYKDGTCTDAEKLLLKKWFLSFETDQDISFSETQFDDLENAMWTGIRQELELREEIKVLNLHWKLWVSAAAILLLVGLFTFISIRHWRANDPLNRVSLKSPDLFPRSNQAFIIYNNGTKKTFAGKEYFAVEDKQNYSPATTQPTFGFNTIVIPRGGGDYHVILADGTEVWLNAASSLKYPVSFRDQHDRVVELTGEGYFQVAHNKAKPFRVKTVNQTVEVLGTHFNINSYDDEPYVATTLMSGSVKLSTSGGQKLLKPGEQALLNLNAAYPKVINVDTSAIVAWKNGIFQFRRANIHDVMRQIARWYDIDVEYTGEVPEKRFTGKMYRNLKLSETLEVLTYFNVDFTLEGHKLTINK